MFNILAPIFGLIALAYASRKVNILGPSAYIELNRFVASLALPALLFDNVAHVTPAQLRQPGFLAAFALGALVVFAVPLLFGREERAFGDRALDGLSACYPNTGYIGLPLAFLAFGPPSAPGSTIAAVFTACVLFAMAIALLEWNLHRGHAVGVAALKVGSSLARNPILLAPILALTVTMGLWEMPAWADRVVKLLAGSAGPCALVAHGLFLARDDPSNTKLWVLATRPRPLALVTLKLVAQPLITALLAVYAFGLTGMDAQLVVILSALPTGTGAFMLADVYKRDLAVTSTTIMASTIASAVTLSLCLAVLPRVL
ncbi:MAG TPA: AEC family transporter [Casimicrobiaceae bacterium]|nr:AEC family transporter [Casimicrobiaceae bacterium]